MIGGVVFTPDANQDVSQAYGWYESREPGLGEDFLRCVEVCLLTIRRHPHIFPVAVNEFRRAIIRRFPYELFYESTDDCITVYAVFHCSQNPEKWLRRLP